MTTALVLVFFVSTVLVVATLVGFQRLARRVRDLPRRDTSSPPAVPDDAPRVLVQLPVYDEPIVVERVLRSIAALDWPRERLKVQLLDDSAEAIAAEKALVVARIRELGLDVDHVRRGGREGYKAGALAHGLMLDGAPFVAVFDADFVPHPSFLRHAVAVVAFHASNALGAVQALAQDAHYLVEQGVRAAGGLPIQSNGTGGLWRRAAVDTVGGWSGDTLAEDLDLALRLALAGHPGLYREEPVSIGEVPEHGSAFHAQQARWAKGIVQVGRKHLGAIWRSRWSLEAKLMTTHWFVMQAAPTAIVAMLVSGFALAWMGVWWAPAAMALIVASGLATLVAVTRPAHDRYSADEPYWRLVARVPVVYLGLAATIGGAILSAFGRRPGVFARTPKRGK
jgi:cellulose synthase/poly-beta-1,6-N-acetylglucosamine synthase-like glycosyltransferase